MLGVEVFPSALPINRNTIGVDINKRTFENFKFIKELVDDYYPPILRLPSSTFPNIGGGVVSPVNLSIPYTGVVAIPIPNSLHSLTRCEVSHTFRRVYTQLQETLFSVFGVVPLIVVEPGTKRIDKGFDADILARNLKEMPVALDQIGSWGLSELHGLGLPVFADALLLSDLELNEAMSLGMFLRYRENNNSQDTPVAANAIKEIPEHLKDYPKTIISCRHSIDVLKMV
jgi:hypothetical protein